MPQSVQYPPLQSVALDVPAVLASPLVPLRLTTTIEIDPQALDTDGILTRTTSGPGVLDRISSSRKNLRASVGLAANNELIIFHPIRIASTSDRSSVRERNRDRAFVEDHAQLAACGLINTLRSHPGAIS